MISGSELRNLFNRIMKKLYLINDNSSTGIEGRTKYTKTKSLNNIDLYIESCYEILNEFDKIQNLDEEVLLDFLSKFQDKTIYFLEKPIKNETSKECKKLTEKYLNELKKYYEDLNTIKKINCVIESIKKHKKTNLFERPDKNFKNKKNTPISKVTTREKKNIEFSKIISQNEKNINKVYEELISLENNLKSFFKSSSEKNKISRRFVDVYDKSLIIEDSSSIKSFIQSYILLSNKILKEDIHFENFSSSKNYFKLTAKSLEKELLKKFPLFDINLISKIDEIEGVSIPNKNQNKDNLEQKKEKNLMAIFLMPFVFFLMFIKFFLKLLTNKNMILIIISVGVLYFGYTNFNFQNMNEIDNTSEEEILEKPIPPKLEQFELSKLENEVIKLITIKKEFFMEMKNLK